MRIMVWRNGFRFLALLITFFFLPSNAMAAEQDLWLTAEDGFRLSAVYVSPESTSSGKVVVLLHMFKQEKSSWQPLMEILEEKGVSSLAIDMRGHGRSIQGPDEKDHSQRVAARDAALFNSMYKDAEAGVRFLLQKGYDPAHIGLVGASVGCSVAIHTVVRNKVSVGAVVLMTPGSNYLGVPTLEHIKKWSHTPLLILSSEEEKDRGAVPIYQALKSKGAELRLFEEEDIHGTYMFDEVEDVEQLIVDWLKKKL